MLIFKKTFDSMDRTKIMKILKAYNVPPRLLRTISKLYKNTRTKVITPSEKLSIFK